jgi:membrane protease YdiL (CAAX protease family)
MEDPNRYRMPVQWSAGELLVVLYLWVFFWPPLARLALSQTGFFAAYYGADAVAIADASAEQRLQQRDDLAVFTGPGSAEIFLSEARQGLLSRFNLWTLAVAFPFQFASIPLLLFLTSGIRPQQLGLTTRRLGANMLAGLIAALVLTPVVFCLNYTVEQLVDLVIPGKVQQHPLTLVAQEHLWPVEWGLLFFMAVIAAPVMEEMVFRGLLQPYFMSNPSQPAEYLPGVARLLVRLLLLAVGRHGGHLAVAAALALAAAACGRDVWSARSAPLATLMATAAPLIFVAGMVPVYLVVWLKSRTPTMPAIFGTALAFAALHSSVWPTPVALFVLGLGLGVLAWRSQSLAGPIVLHALFNGTNCVVLFLHPSV